MIILVVGAVAREIRRLFDTVRAVPMIAVGLTLPIVLRVGRGLRAKSRFAVPCRIDSSGKRKKRRKRRER